MKPRIPRKLKKRLKREQWVIYASPWEIAENHMRRLEECSQVEEDLLRGVR